MPSWYITLLWNGIFTNVEYMKNYMNIALFGNSVDNKFSLLFLISNMSTSRGIMKVDIDKLLITTKWPVEVKYKGGESLHVHL